MIRGLQAGARGFLLKDTSREALVNTMHAAARGDSLLGPGVVECLLARVGAAQKQPALPAGPPLSERELEVLQAVARGETNKGVAVQLGISERTVKAHLASVYNKLGVDSRAAAIAIAVQQGRVVAGSCSGVRQPLYSLRNNSLQSKVISFWVEAVSLSIAPC